MTLELREIFELEQKNIQESKDKNILFKIYAPFITTDKLNLNDRIYPEDIVSRAIESFGGKIKDSKILSQLNHPAGVHPNIDKVSHIVSGISYDKKEKRGYAELSVLNTTSGRDLKSIIDSGAKLGVSLRGKGTVGDDKKVQPDFELFGVDIVSSPGFEDAKFDKSNIYESYNPKEENKIEPKKITQEQFLAEVNNLLEIGFARDEHEKNWDKYIDEHTAHAVLVIKKEHEKKGDDLSEVFKEAPKKEDLVLKEKRRLTALYRDARRGGFTGSFSEWVLRYQRVETIKPSKKTLTEDEKKQQEIRMRIHTERIAGKLSKAKKLEE
jgi:hypothetical protein